MTNSVDVSPEVSGGQLPRMSWGMEIALPDFTGGNLNVEPAIPRVRFQLRFRFLGTENASESSAGGRLLGLFSDDPGLVDEIMEEVRELRRREPAG